MGKPSKELMEFMAKHGIDSDEVWEVRAGGAWAIKHKAIERAAAKAGIVFDRPAVIESNAADRIAVVIVFAHLGDRTEWSFGEASPANNKNAYCYSMAEKRGKDRCVLKLLDTHGSLYSESEADEFERRPNPHVTRPEDIGPTVEYDAQGNPVDNIPHGDGEIERLPKSHAKPDFASAQFEMRQIKTVEALQKWGASNANRIATYPRDWQEIMRGLYAEHMNELRQGKAA